MGLFNDSSNTEHDIEKYKSQINQFLSEDEVLEQIYYLEVDYIAITNKRLLLLYKNMTLKSMKTCFYSITYDNIYCIGIVVNEKTKEFRRYLELITKWGSLDLRFLKGQDDIITIYNKINDKLISAN